MKNKPHKSLLPREASHKDPHGVTLVAPITLFSCVLAASLFVTEAAAAQSPRAIVGRYLSHYATSNFDSLEAYMSPTVQFDDPSATVQGQDAVMAHFRDVFSYTTIKAWEPSRWMVSGDQVLTQGRIVFEQLGASLGLPLRAFEFDLDMIITVTLRDGKVQRHVDFVPLNDYNRQLREQRQQ